MDSSYLWVIVAIVLLFALSWIRILAEYERGVIFRLGRVLAEPKGPGIFLVFRPLDRMVRISLRTETLEVPAQDVVTRDNVTVKVNAVIYFRVIDPKLAVLEVTNFLYATSQLAQTTKWSWTNCSASARSSTSGCNRCSTSTPARGESRSAWSRLSRWIWPSP